MYIILYKIYTYTYAQILLKKNKIQTQKWIFEDKTCYTQIISDIKIRYCSR